jgi:hypothetical protein
MRRPRAVLFLATGMLFAAVVSVAHAASMSPQELNIDRPGGDYRNFSLPEPNPLLCQNSCGADNRCLAWNYDPRGGGGTAQNPRCFLKDSPPGQTGAPDPTLDAGLTSGVKIRGSAAGP